MNKDNGNLAWTIPCACRYKGCDAWPATAIDLEHHLVLDTTSSATPAELAERAMRWMSSRGLLRLPVVAELAWPGEHRK